MKTEDKTVTEEAVKEITKSNDVKERVKLSSNEVILGLNSKELQVQASPVSSNERELSKNEVNLTKIYVILTFIIAFSIFIFAASINPEVFRLEQSTSKILNQAVNAVVLLVIPFLFGAMGGLTRIMLTDLKIKQKGMLIISSGLMAIFSWVAIKSDLLFSPQHSAVETQHELANLIGVAEISSFYSSSLIAIIVGMMATSFYISILSRVELQLAKASSGKSQLLDEHSEGSQIDVK